MDAGELFDDWARRGRAEGMERGHGETAAPLLRSLPVEAGTRFLDLGCGNGWAARWAKTQGAEAHGVDASGEMVERARAAGVEASVGDFADLPYPDGSFDVVWSMEAVYYAPDADAVLREVARVLRPGGVFHMLVDFYGENAASHSWPDDVGVPMVLRGETEWVRAFEAAGLREVRSGRLRAADAPDGWKRREGTLHVTGRA